MYTLSTPHSVIIIALALIAWGLWKPWPKMLTPEGREHMDEMWFEACQRLSRAAASNRIYNLLPGDRRVEDIKPPKMLLAPDQLTIILPDPNVFSPAAGIEPSHLIATLAIKPDLSCCLTLDDGEEVVYPPDRFEEALKEASEYVANFQPYIGWDD